MEKRAMPGNVQTRQHGIEKYFHIVLIFSVLRDIWFNRVARIQPNKNRMYSGISANNDEQKSTGFLNRSNNYELLQETPGLCFF